MTTLQRRLSAGWSFTAGAFFGAVAVFVLLSSLHIPRLKAEASEHPSPPPSRPRSAPSLRRPRLPPPPLCSRRIASSGQPRTP